MNAGVGLFCLLGALILALDIGLVPVATEVQAQDKDFANGAKALENEISRQPGSAESWRKWADFALERFRVLRLQLRGTQSGMAVLLRLEAEGSQSRTGSREELLRRSAAADPEQREIWGELGVEQMRRGMREEAAAALEVARKQQEQDSWTLELGAMMAAAQKTVLGTTRL